MKFKWNGENEGTYRVAALAILIIYYRSERDYGIRIQGPRSRLNSIGVVGLNIIEAGKNFENCIKLIIVEIFDLLK